ncbi:MULTISPECIES: acyl-CoA dehydrogenase family protein [unclassified Microbacterium]|uniref:acyl-CoA dehydrogenase family protein n=1 Tax=unclassified Microbacterium TaxID=2609290 RepID=UPI00214ADC47|nr:MULTISPECIES: acyl-CoA dehydrogenase family protein [unclassified Microbacterium]MCR2783281.1 acyl-CoA dehydrogenase family protein [Microbacterium sp. zg.B96]MDL5351935.1 acyl-CoA dehydrogenase family protein [Microbacterium sp. zg-YB36]WIM15844.1 acyl-CoA dehydrogenase family protein [Microbacterium sp. zg-B96]
MTTIGAPHGVRTAMEDVVGEIRERIEEIERLRRIPADLHKTLRDAGMYRLLLPSSHGGLQASSDEVLDVIETLAAVDGSVAWATSIGIQSPAVLSWLPRATFERIYAEGSDITVGGAFGPQGQAEVVDGGYRVTGRWGFASGCDNWDFLFANCVVTQGGQPRPGGPDGPPGQPATRAMLVPRADAEIIDTWHTLGMRGTGSNDFTLQDVFVPEEFTFGLGAEPCIPGITRYPLIEFGFELASIAIGVAQGALNDVADSAAGRQRVMARTRIADDAVAQHRIGRAHTELRAARALIRASALSLRENPEQDFIGLMTEASAANASVIDTCIDVVGMCFRTYGARGIYSDSSLQRRLRDIYTIAQHATLNDSAWTRQGVALFGGPGGPS